MNQDAINQLRKPHPQQKAIDAHAAALLRRTGKYDRRATRQSSALNNVSVKSQLTRASEATR